MPSSLLNARTSSPVAFWKHHPGADECTEDLVAATLAFQQATQCDLVKLMPAGHYQVAGRGVHGVWQGDALGRRSFLSRAVQQPADWARLSAALTTQERAMVEAARRVRRALDPQRPLLATVFAPLTQAMMLAGSECLQTHLRHAGEAVQAGLATLTAATQTLIAAYAEAGVDGIYLAAQHMSDALVPLPLYRSWARDSDLQTLAACADFAGNVLHVHGSGVHFEALPSNGHWTIHYELEPGNATPETYRRHTRLAAAIGLPFAIWDDAAAVDAAIAAALRRFGQRTALLTGPCVVPLAVPTARIATWIRHARHAAARSSRSD